MSEREVFVVGATRTAIGGFGGSLKDIPLSSLATTVVRAALERAGTAPEHVDHVVMGNVVPTEPRDAYLSRVAAMDAGIPRETPAFNVNRLCGSALGAGARRSGAGTRSRRRALLRPIVARAGSGACPSSNSNAEGSIKAAYPFTFWAAAALALFRFQNLVKLV